MVTRPTVLVLGAAASMSYNFPLGAQLLKDLIDRPASRSDEGGRVTFCNPLALASQHLSLDYREMERFSIELGNAGVRSIDEFLACRPDHAKMGKLAIAGRLIPGEDPLAFSRSDVNASGWYSQHLLPELLGRGPDDFRRNQLSIVSLNYDRSLEAFLYQALQSRYNLSDADAFELSTSLKIIHPHGLLGEFSIDEHGGRCYSRHLTSELLTRACDGIRIIGEALGDDAVYEEARLRVTAADRVMFLGFAYHPLVMERLGVKYLTAKLIEGTTFGMTQREVDDLREDYGIFIDHRQDWDIGTRLRHSQRLSR